MAPSATDRAYEWLHSEIMLGNLTSGTFVDEATVCAATGVSRTPVREAFQRLAGERILQLVPRRGAQVRDVSVRDVVDAFGARWLIESAAVQHVLSRDTDVASAMRPILEQMRELTDISSGSLQVEYISLDKAFHRVCVAAMDNAVLLQFFETLWPLHEWSILRGGLDLPSFVQLLNDEHTQFLEALERRDEESALAVLRKHLRSFS